MLKDIETPIFTKRKKNNKKVISFSGPGGAVGSVNGSIDNSSIWSEPKKVQFMQPGDCESPGLRKEKIK